MSSWWLIISVACGVLGFMLGDSQRERSFAALWGFLLGPIGLIVGVIGARTRHKLEEGAPERFGECGSAGKTAETLSGLAHNRDPDRPN